MITPEETPTAVPIDFSRFDELYENTFSPPPRRHIRQNDPALREEYNRRFSVPLEMINILQHCDLDWNKSTRGGQNVIIFPRGDQFGDPKQVVKINISETNQCLHQTRRTQAAIAEHIRDKKIAFGIYSDFFGRTTHISEHRFAACLLPLPYHITAELGIEIAPRVKDDILCSFALTDFMPIHDPAMRYRTLHSGNIEALFTPVGKETYEQDLNKFYKRYVFLMNCLVMGNNNATEGLLGSGRAFRYFCDLSHAVTKHDQYNGFREIIEDRNTRTQLIRFVHCAIVYTQKTGQILDLAGKNNWGFIGEEPEVSQKLLCFDTFTYDRRTITEICDPIFRNIVNSEPLTKHQTLDLVRILNYVRYINALAFFLRVTDRNKRQLWINIIPQKYVGIFAGSDIAKAVTHSIKKFS